MSPAGGCRRTIRGRHVAQPSQPGRERKQNLHNTFATAQANTMRQEWGKVVDKSKFVYSMSRFRKW
jgi:hypothetical protein